MCALQHVLGNCDTARPRPFPKHCPTFGAKDDGSVQGSAPMIENTLQLQAVNSERTWVEMTVWREWRGNGREPIGCLTCGWPRGSLSSLALCPRKWRSHPWFWRSRLRVVPAPEPEHDVGLRCPPSRLLGQGGTSNDCLGHPKSRLVCVCSLSLQRRRRESLPLLKMVGRAPSLHIALCGVALDLDCPDLVVGNQKPVPDVCSRALGSQGFALWPVDRRDGTFAVDVQRERVQSDVPCHGRCVVLAIARCLPWQHVARNSPMRSSFEVPHIVDRHHRPACSPQSATARRRAVREDVHLRGPAGTARL